MSTTRGKSYDLVFATSSRLMTAALGATVARRTKGQLYLDFRDIFTDTLSDLFAGDIRQIVLPALRLLEARTVKTASQINLVSPGFVDHFSRIRNDVDFRVYTNGIDDVFIGQDFSRNKSPSSVSTILYAGNIGKGQGLDRIVPEAAARLGSKFQFVIVGDGGMRQRLELRLAEKRVFNVHMMAPVPRDQLIQHYRNADILFLHLNDYPAFRKVLPSKLFEFGATGKPVLAGVAGYASEFVRTQLENSAVFEPCDADGLVSSLNTLKLEDTPRPAFIDKYRRSTIAEQFALDIVSTVSI